MTNKSGSVLYTGMTRDLLRRVWEHKTKDQRISEFVRKYNVDKLVYYEYGESVSDIIRREKEIKGWLRQKKIDLIKKFNPKWDDLYLELTGDSSLRSE
jgi:putative endonuclease